jgi:hypothetical protein
MKEKTKLLMNLTWDWKGTTEFWRPKRPFFGVDMD